MKCNVIYGNRNIAPKNVPTRVPFANATLLDGHLLPCVIDTVVDGGVHTDKALTYSNHCNIICAKANARDNLILCSFRSSYVDVLVHLLLLLDL